LTYQTRVILRRTLPAVFWLLAVSCSIGIPFATQWTAPDNYWWGFAVAALVMGAIGILYRVERHTSSATESFQVAVLLGIASYWVPTVVFSAVVVWGYLYYRLAFSGRSVLATLLGFGLVAVYAALFVAQGWIGFPWAAFFSPDYAWGWIPTGAVFVAWLASTIARKILHER